LLAGNFLGGPLHPTLSSLLATQSEGNPFFIEELLHNWVEMGALTQKDCQWNASVPLDEQVLPPNLVGAIRQRFARLSTALIDDLRVASIIGRTFASSLLAAVQQKELEVVEELLLEAVHARLVHADQQGDFIFSHDKFRECLYVEVSVSRRRRLHGMIGHLLEGRFEHEEMIQPVYQLAELAFHFSRSDNLEHGIDYSLRAAAQARQSFAPKEALALYHAALRLLAPGDRRRGDVLLRLGEVALMAGEEAEAERMYQAAQGWLVHVEQREALARAHHGLGRAYWRQDRRDEARAAFERVIALLEKRCCIVLVEALADLAVLLTVYISLQEEGSAYAQQALVMAHQLGDVDLEMRVRRMVASNLAALRAEDLCAAIQFVEQVQTQTEASGNLTEAAECCLHLVVAYYWMAQVRRSQTAGIHLLTIIERCQQPYHLRLAHTLQVLSFACLGAWVDAEQMAARAHTIVDKLADPIPLAFLHQCCGFLAYQQENYLVAECELQDALVDQSIQSGLGDIMFNLGLLGLVQATLGKEEETRAYVARLEAYLALLPAGILPTAPLMVCLALIGLTLGDDQRVQCLYSHLLAFQGQQYWFLVDRVLGLLALHKKQWDAAAKHLATAKATARNEGLCPGLARTLQAQAEVEIARGDQGNILHARVLLEEALALFEGLGMAHSIQLCRNQLHTLSPPTNNSHHCSPPTLPANLTQREVAVLKLVACGKSNKQIAQELGITEKTVTNHLTHIFNKTMCDNRA